MGYLLNLSLALLVLAAPDLGWQSPLVELSPCVALLLVPPALGWIAGRLHLRGRFRAANAALVMLTFSPPAAFAAQVLLFGWNRGVEAFLGREVHLLGWADVGQVLAFLPFVVLQLAAIHVRARLLGGRTGGRSSGRFQQRMFLSALAPLSLAFVLALATGLAPALRTRIEEVALYDGLYSTALLAVMAISLPFLLRF